MKTLVIRIAWMAGFMLTGTLVAGSLISLIIITGFTKQMGEHWAWICVGMTDLILLLSAVLGLWLSIGGRLPSTRETKEDRLTM
jgi:hypothetical protein